MKPDTRTLSAQLHDKILEMIIDPEENCENMLLTESGLVDKFGYSKAPVREALLRLCAEEVLTSIPRCGYVIVRLGEKSSRDNMVVREMLEMSTLDQYFHLFTPEKIDAIQTKLNANRANLTETATVWEIWAANLEFHCDLIAVSDNPYLVKHLKSCMDVERRYYAQTHYLSAKHFEARFYPEAHERILDAIRRGDKASALNLLKQDISGTEIG